MGVLTNLDILCELEVHLHYWVKLLVLTKYLFSADHKLSLLGEGQVSMTGQFK